MWLRLGLGLMRAMKGALIGKYLLQEDGISYILQEDGVSRILLEEA